MSALNTQIGGNHYKGFAIQPVEYSHRNQLGFLAGCVIKRICRFNQTGGKGRQDLEKSVHEVELLIELNDKRLEEPVPGLMSIYQLPIGPQVFCKRNIQKLALECRPTPRIEFF